VISSSLPVREIRSSSGGIKGNSRGLRRRGGKWRRDAEEVKAIYTADPLFFIFSQQTHWENNFCNVWYYHIVNMNHDNGTRRSGFKNGSLLSAPSCERLTAHSCKRSGVWVCGSVNDKFTIFFRCWLVPALAYNTSGGLHCRGYYDTVRRDEFGSMKGSPEASIMSNTFPRLDGIYTWEFFLSYLILIITAFLHPNPNISLFSPSILCSCEYFCRITKRLVVHQPQTNAVDQF